MADSGTGQGVVEQAQTAVGQVVDQAQQTAGQVTGQAKQQATGQLESQKGRLVDSLVTVSQALRQTGQQLNEQQQGAVAGYVDRAAEQVERTTNYLRGRNVGEIVGDTQELARREPALFLAGAVALGFVGARFLMSSGQRGQQALPTGGPSSGVYGAYGNRPDALTGRQPYPYGQSGPAWSPAAVPGHAEGTGSLGVAATSGRRDPLDTFGGRADPLEPPVA